MRSLAFLALIGLVIGSFSCPNEVVADLVITTIDNIGNGPFDTSQDFDSFTGSGFKALPAAGQLDSDTWRVQGFSDCANCGLAAFNCFPVTENNGRFDFNEDIACGPNDYTRQNSTSTGGVSTGGTYAFDIDGCGDIVLGVQPSDTGSDFTPGSMTLRVRNDTGQTVPDWTVRYRAANFNDTAASNTVDFQFAVDTCATCCGCNGCVFGLDIEECGCFTTLESTTVGEGATTDAWSQTEFIQVGFTAPVPAGGFIFFRWLVTPTGGTGTYDEFGLNSVQVRANPEPGSLALTGIATLSLIGYGWRKKRRKRRSANDE